MFGLKTKRSREQAKERKVLSWVNEERARFGLSPIDQLPRGSTHSPDDCVIARALIGTPWKVSVGPETVRYYTTSSSWQGVTVKVPDFVTDFIVDFDRGRLPHLDIEKAQLAISA